jgi:DNA-binding NarL/FixJ family response regulator
VRWGVEIVMRKQCIAGWSDPRFGELFGQLCDKLQAIRFALAAIEIAHQERQTSEIDALQVATRSAANGVAVLQRIAQLRAEDEYGNSTAEVHVAHPSVPTLLMKPLEKCDPRFASQQVGAADTFLQAEFDEFASIRANFDGLTPREREVFGLVTSGLLNKQVAGALNLSETTVKIHRGNMMRKMHAESLANLVRMAEALGVRELVSRFRHG